MSSHVVFSFHMRERTEGEERLHGLNALHQMTHNSFIVDLRNYWNDRRGIRFKKHLWKIQIFSQQNTLLQSQKFCPLGWVVHGQSLTQGSNNKTQLISNNNSYTRNTATINGRGAIYIDFVKPQWGSSPTTLRGWKWGKVPWIDLLEIFHYVLSLLQHLQGW